MKLISKITLFLMLFLSAGGVLASHISGAEISYKHLFGTSYRFKLKVYRDCNECKFNGIGGGDNTSSCNEVPDLLIRGALGTSNSTTVLGNIEVKRKYIQDLSLTCNSALSKCRPGSTINSGYEVHVFEGDFDFASLLNNGYCKLDVSINMSSRSVNINTQQSEQNFFNYAMLNLCEALPNESVEFAANPQFMYYLNQSNFSALQVQNTDKDSLAFSLKPALVNRNVAINYANGRNSDMPFTYYCQSSGTPPCPVNLLGPLVEGFYCSKSNGDIAFTPVQANQGGVMVVECEEWKRNANGNYYLAGVVRRDVYAEVIIGNNNLPVLKTKLGKYSICEGESFALEINAEDLPFGSSANDTVHIELISSLPGSSLEKIPVNYAPYFKYVFRVEPALNQIGEHLLTLVLQDNHCPLNGQVSKSFSFTVLQKRNLNIFKEVLNCGQLNAIAQNYPNKIIAWTLKDEQLNILKQVNAKKLNYTLSKGGTYYIETVLAAEPGLCEVRKIDTLIVGNLKPPTINMGADISACKGTELLLTPSFLETFDAYSLSVNGNTFAGFPYPVTLTLAQKLSFKITQKNGCTYEDIINLNVFNPLSRQVHKDTFCSNGVFPVRLSTIQTDLSKVQKIDYTFNSSSSTLLKVNAKEWNFDVNNKSNPLPHVMTIYSVLTDFNNCQYKDTSWVQVLAPDPINIKAPEPACVNAGMIPLETKSTGNWECVNFPSLIKNNQLKLSGQVNNTLILKYTETKFCSNSETYMMSLLDTTAINFGHSKDLLFCENSPAFQLDALPKKGNWTGDGVLGDLFIASGYGGKKWKIQYEFKNQNACVSKSDINITVEKLPALKVISGKQSVCIGDVLPLQVLSSVQGNGYWYSDGNGRFDNLSSQMTNYQASTDDVMHSPVKFVYTLQTNGICGNVSSDVLVKIKNGPSGDIVNDFKDSVCEPASFKFKSTFKDLEKQYWIINDTVVEEFDYSFDFNTVLKAGTYVIKTKVADSACEALAISKPLTVLPSPHIEWLSNPTARLSREYPRLYLKDKTTCKTGHSVNWYYNQKWIGDSREFYYTVDDSKDTFTLKMVVESGVGGCKDSAGQVFVFIPINQLYIPDAFSPDSKGPDENNKFKVKGPAMREFEIEIYNKYGEKVFESNNMNEAWDGTYKNIDCMMGVYFYKIISTDYEGISRDYSGTITLVR